MELTYQKYPTPMRDNFITEINCYRYFYNDRNGKFWKILGKNLRSPGATDSSIHCRLQCKEGNISLFNFTMARFNKLSGYTRKHVVALYKRGPGHRKVPTRLEITISAISDKICRFKYLQIFSRTLKINIVNG